MWHLSIAMIVIGQDANISGHIHHPLPSMWIILRNTFALFVYKEKWIGNFIKQQCTTQQKVALFYTENCLHLWLSHQGVYKQVQFELCSHPLISQCKQRTLQKGHHKYLSLTKIQTLAYQLWAEHADHHTAWYNKVDTIILWLDRLAHMLCW